jgi:hypothetical protein
VDSLLDTSIELSLRRALARKISRAPSLWPELRTALENVAAHADDETVRSACRDALARPQGLDTDPAQDLQRWHHQVEVEQSVEGIFPTIFASYEAAPALCASILKTVLLNPTCRGKLYYDDFRVDDTAIIKFLTSRDAFDDDLCRYCIDQALVSSNPNYFVAALRNRPSFPGLADALWQILEGAKYSSELDHSLLLELLVLASGGEVAAGDALRSRILALSQPPSAVAYMRLLDSVASWPPAKAIIAELISTRALLDATNLEILSEAVRDLFPGADILQPEAPGPGLADD